MYILLRKKHLQINFLLKITNFKLSMKSIKIFKKIQVILAAIV